MPSRMWTFQAFCSRKSIPWRASRPVASGSRRYPASVRSVLYVTAAMLVIIAAGVSIDAAVSSTGWGTPVLVDVQLGDQYGLAGELSCASRSFCVAFTGPDVVTYKGTAWSNPSEVDPLAVESAVSCPTASFCVAVLGHQVPGNPYGSGYASVYDGSSWSSPTEIDPHAMLLGISCATALFCLASEDGIHDSVFTYRHGQWSGPQQLAKLGNGLISVSCPTPSFCVAVGADDAFVYRSGAWAGPMTIDSGGVALGLQQVSCTSASFCVAIDNKGYARVFDGRSWSSQALLNTGDAQNQYLSSVHCPVPTDCVAVGGAIGGIGYFASWNGQSWSASMIVDVSQGVGALSCPSTHFCMAIDSGGNALMYRP